MKWNPYLVIALGGVLAVVGCTAAERKEALQLGGEAVTVTKTACRYGEVLAAVDPALVKAVPGAGVAGAACELLAD